MITQTAIPKPAKVAQEKKQPAVGVVQNASPYFIPDLGGTLYRKASCACGGGCPSCQGGDGLKVSHPNAAAEIEADSIADRMMRMPADRTSSVNTITPAKKTIHRKCSTCEDEEPPIRRKPLPAGGTPLPSQGRGHVGEALLSGGRPLDRETRSFFEPRLGYDLGRVRLHTGAAAARSAFHLGAEAYTLGSSIVFGREYRSASETDRHLLAHELVHVTQQNSGLIHRKLKIDDKASDDPPNAVSTIQPMIKQLCPDFDVTGNEVTANAGTDCANGDAGKVAAGAQPVGCCCLCTLVTAKTKEWRIIVTTDRAPKTDPTAKEVRMTPTAGPTAPDVKYWTGGASPTVQPLSSVAAFGHELCGHASLMEINAHAGHGAKSDRAYSDVHDSTVKIENALGKEMGLPGDRGLASDGAHRGESLRVFKVGPFSADADDPAPFAAQIAAAADFLNKNEDLLADEIGFSSPMDTIATVGKSRATKVESELAKAVKTGKVDVETKPGKTPESLTRIQPGTDGGVGAFGTVEIRMAIRPAGLVNPPGAKPPAKPVHVNPEHPGTVKKLRAGGKGVNECHKLLAETGWK